MSRNIQHITIEDDVESSPRDVRSEPSGRRVAVKRESAPATRTVRHAVLDVPTPTGTGSRSLSTQADGRMLERIREAAKSRNPRCCAAASWHTQPALTPATFVGGQYGRGTPFTRDARLRGAHHARNLTTTVAA